MSNYLVRFTARIREGWTCRGVLLSIIVFYIPAVVIHFCRAASAPLSAAMSWRPYRRQPRIFSLHDDILVEMWHFYCSVMCTPCLVRTPPPPPLLMMLLVRNICFRAGTRPAQRSSTLYLLQIDWTGHRSKLWKRKMTSTALKALIGVAANCWNIIKVWLWEVIFHFYIYLFFIVKTSVSVRAPLNDLLIISQM